MSTISAAQCRAARGMLGWNQDDLSTKARVSLNTLRNFESGRTAPMPNNLDAIRRALEAAGVEFIDPNGGGPGVRMRG